MNVAGVRVASGSRERLLDDLRRRFAPRPAAGPRIGVELELLALDASTRAPHDLRPLLAAGARRGDWRTAGSPKGAPRFQTAAGSVLTLEPGGQLEIATATHESATALLRELTDTVAQLRRHAVAAGVELLAAGIDPFNDARTAPLFVDTERYRALDAYFATVGPAGRRMMRQTAALQLNFDNGAAPERRWRLLQALAPWLVAIFANSPRYAGRATGCRSFRAETWRQVDRRRTGLVGGADATAAYLEFALAAPEVFRRDGAGHHPPFAARLEEGGELRREWKEHLSTLFPEVRPRGYLEIRSCDAVDPAWCAAPVALVGGLLEDPVAFSAAVELLGEPEPDLLARAGVAGLADATIAARADDLWELALAGCERLGEGWLALPDLDVAREFARRYTRARRCPGDDA